MQAPPPQAIVRQMNIVARAEIEAIVAGLRAGGEAAWSAPTACAGWVARDVVVHLVGVNQFFLAATRAALEGTTAPSFEPAQHEARLAPLRQLSNEALLGGLERSREAYATYLESLSDQQLSRPVEMPFGALPAWQLDGVTLNEIAIHHWDLRARREADARISAEAVPMLLPVNLGAVALLANGEKPDGTWQLDLTGPAGGPLTIRAQGGQVTAQPGPAPNPDARLALEAEALIRLIWGRLDLAEAIEKGQIQVQGDRGRALALQQMFRGV